MDKVPKKIKVNMRKAIKEGLSLVAISAGKNHRYTTRSGQLDRAYSGQPRSPRKNIVIKEVPGLMTGTVFLVGAPRATPYSHRIHEGFGTWKPDRFVPAAVRRERGKVLKLMEQAFNKGIKDAGF